MTNKDVKDLAEIMAEKIIIKVAYHLRYKMEKWPKEDDLKEIKREVKSIIVQYMPDMININNKTE